MAQLNGSSLPPRLAPLADRLERERRFLRRIPAAISSIFESIRRAREESAADQEEEAEEFERRQRAQEDAAGDLVMGATGAGDVDAAPEPEVYVSAAEEEDEMEAAIRAPQPPERMVTAPLIDLRRPTEPRSRCWWILRSPSRSRRATATTPTTWRRTTRL